MLRLTPYVLMLAFVSFWATTASAIGILVSENNVSVKASRAAIVRIDADTLEIHMQMLISDGDEPVVWLIPMERKTSTMTDTNREIVIEAADDGIFAALEALTRPQLQPSCDGEAVGSLVAVPLRAGSFGQAVGASSSKIFPQDRSEDIVGYLEGRNLAFTEAQATAHSEVLNGSSIFVAATYEPMGETTIGIKVRYKAKNDGELALNSLVGSLDGDTPDLVVWSLASQRMSVSSEATIDFDDIIVDETGLSNYDLAYDRAVMTNPTAFVVDYAGRFDGATMMQSPLSNLVAPGINDYVTRAHGRPAEGVIEGLLKKLSLRPSGGPNVPAEHAVASQTCGDMSTSGGQPTTGMPSSTPAESGGDANQPTEMDTPSTTTMGDGQTTQDIPMEAVTLSGGQMETDTGTGNSHGGCGQAPSASGGLPIIIIMLMSLFSIALRRRKA